MLLDLGHGVWAERKEGRVRITLRGVVSVDWSEAEARALAAQLFKDDDPAKEERVWHLARDAKRTVCSMPIGDRTLLADAPGRWLCFNCNRRQTRTP